MAVHRLNDSPMAMSFTSPLDFKIAIRQEAERRVDAPEGILPLAITEQIENRPSAVDSHSAKIFRCSYHHPDGPVPEPLGRL